MPEEKKQQISPLEVIALPPLKMVLVHAKDECVNKAALASAIRRIAIKTMARTEPVCPQDVMKIIEHLEKKP